MATTLLQSDLPGLNLIHRGKVRDVFDLGDGHLPAGTPAGEYLLIVATDRLSAFDVVLPDPIPGKGEMLCQVSNFWFGKTQHLMANHLTGTPVADVLPAGIDPALYGKRDVIDPQAPVKDAEVPGRAAPRATPVAIGVCGRAKSRGAPPKRTGPVPRRQAYGGTGLPNASER